MCITYLMSTMGVVSIHQTKSCCISSSSSPIFGPKLGCTIPAAKTWKSSGWTRSKPLRSCGAFPCVSRTRALGLIRLLSNISRAYSVLISWPETKGAEDFFFYAVCPYALVVKIHGFLAHVDPFFWGSMDLWLDFLDHAPLRDELDRRLVFSYEKQPLCHCPRLVPNVWNGRMGWLLLVISSDYGSFPHSLPPVRRLAIGFHWNSKARSHAHRCREVWYEFFWLINLSRVFPPSHPNTISEADFVSEVQVPSKQLILKPNN